MYLTTHTNFFITAISHAGISSISSYWGKGYWEYLYSQVATAKNFPWNNKELNNNQNSVLGADSVKTSVLLLYDNEAVSDSADESRPFYTALKMLNREVEFKEIDKENLQISDYDKRVLWQETILSWFDKKLKKQPDWWSHLYPKKNP